MTTLTLAPNRRYRTTGATTATKAVGSTDLSGLAQSAVGTAAVAIADGTEVITSTPITVSFTGTTLEPYAGQFSLLAGANANARRILVTSATNSAPTLATDGYSLQGAGLTIIDFVTAGAITWQLYTYSATSGLWQLDTSLGTSGNVAFGGAGSSRTEVDLRGLDRMAVVVSVNAGSSAVQAWATGVPVARS